MLKSLQTQLKRASRWLPVALLPFAANAQFNYAPSNAINVAGTYTDLGTNGTAIATANTDDDNSTAQTLPFTFTFNGTAFTQFVLNTNGIIRLGNAAPSSAAAFPTYAQTPELGPISGTNAADVNLIAPFNTDLTAGSAGGTEYRFAVTGTAPNRVCTIQWKNVADKPQAVSATITTVITTQYANFSFQAKLYESSNLIEFVYGTATAGTGTANAKYIAVGIKGSTPTASIVGTKGSTGAWSTTTFLAGPYQAATLANAHNIRQAVLPDPGRTYRFAPTVANDAAVSAVYTLTKLPIPQGVPHAVKALITNNGTAALSAQTVTLDVTGANTFNNSQTISSLAPGASAVVTFAPYVATATGTNTVTVSVPADGNNANNSASVSQAVNTSTYSYADAVAPSSAVGYPPSATLGDVAFLNRYTASGTSLNVTQVRAFLVDAGTGAASSVGKTVYAVVLNPTTGAVLGRSPNYVIAAADVAGTGYTSFTLSTPVAVPVNTDFLVGIAQAYQTGQTTQYYALGVQTENPLRTNTYYLASITNPGAPVDIATGTTPVTYRPMIEAVTTSTSAPACTPVSNLAASAVTLTGATLTFTAPAGTSGYTVTYAIGSGTPVTVTPAPTGSPIVLTGLSSGTSYTVSVVASCAAGANS
ncbi:fibronectin type III domain-containing protein, partial [Hymenobacter rubidus]|uniref:fibronectin type III domain-containing protein n=1 Tax=Hymenobacter rubidus TaxID=1441626 RepID=UPI0019201C1E